MMYKAKRCLQLADPLLRSGFYSLKAVAASSPSIARALCSDRGAAGPAALPARRDGNRKQTKTHGAADGPGRLQHTADFFPKSVFAAGTAKRTREMLGRKEALASLSDDQEEEEAQREDQEAFGRRRQARKDEPPARPLSVAEWRQMKEASDYPNRFDNNMMTLLMTSGAELDIAKSLLSFVAMETGTLSYQLLLHYLKACVKGGHDGEVTDVYEIMRARFPMLETGACSLFIQSFSRTPRWREALDILHHINKVSLPKPRNYGKVIAGAVMHGDWATAWALYDELTDTGLSPDQETWEVLFRGGPSGTRSEAEQDGMEQPGSVSQSEQQERLLAILHNMRNNQVYPQQRLADAIKTWFESLPGQKWKAGWTTVNPKGVCRCCGSLLESIHLTTEEYHQLKYVVMTSIIQGKDVFKKTTPEELNQFKEFVKRKPVFDVVVDGLNVAGMARNVRKAETLLAVVSELESQGQVVLVLGRKHMLLPSRSWDQQSMRLIQKKAHCFFTDDISEDDPFLLYAALHSGNHCRFVSKDLMRDHKACLPDGGSRRLFFKWQRGHQLVVHGLVTPNRRVHFQRILGYDTIIQTLDNTWHIPYDDSVEERTSHEVPQRWLCAVSHQDSLN